MNATVRTFRAPDPRAALAAVRAALGPDAVIISTREVSGGLFRQPEVEVVAGLAEEDKAPAPKAPEPELAPLRRGAAAYAPAAPAPRQETAELAGDLQHLRRSIEDARRALATVGQQTRAGHELQLAPGPAEIYVRLCQRGVEPTLAEELVRQALNEGAAPRAEAVLAGVRQLLAEQLIPDRAPWTVRGRRAIAFVGPTGVGKTTTIAKFAARALMEARLKVALVTVDTYRIGGSEQLVRYGQIMDVPVLVARDRQELSKALERCSGADLVLIDTAGRSSSIEVAQQAALVRTIPQVQLYLAASAATGALELAAVAERYRPLTPERMVFTKVDEAAAPGGILSCAVRISRPVAAITTGQRVPEDLESPSPEALIDLVAGPNLAVR